MTVTEKAINTPVQVGRYKLSNRLVLAPLTRVRNSIAPQDPGVPPSYAPLYYSQRANKGGLLITEATFVAHEASGFPGAPGIYSSAQIESWKRVTEEVHSKGGLIFMQLWALGRVASPKIVKVCGPSNDTYNDVEVAAFTEADIDRYVENYRQGALNAIEAGFDGVEIHGANGYLLDQFLQSVSNKRTGAYGGSLENRFKFPLRVLNAICESIGPDRVGIRMSPFSSFQGMKEEDPLATFVPWTKAIVAAQPKLAYIHAVEGRIAGPNDVDSHPAESLDPIRSIVDDAGIAFIAAGGYTAESGAKVVEDHGGLVAFGRHYIANPDLLARIVNGWDLNKYNRSTFYTKGEEGYTDYPTYEESKL